MLKISQFITVAETYLTTQLSDKFPLHKLNTVKQTCPMYVERCKDLVPVDNYREVQNEMILPSPLKIIKQL